MALTPKGRALYDTLLQEAGSGKNNLHHQQQLSAVFQSFPDSELFLRRRGLAWFRYRLTPVGEGHRNAFSPGADPQVLIERGWLIAQPVTYEDFLPVSAAGIFHANPGDDVWIHRRGSAGKTAFEEALGCSVLDEFALYQQTEDRSKRRCGLR